MSTTFDPSKHDRNPDGTFKTKHTAEVASGIQIGGENEDVEAVKNRALFDTNQAIAATYEHDGTYLEYAKWNSEGNLVWHYGDTDPANDEPIYVESTYNPTTDRWTHTSAGKGPLRLEQAVAANQAHVQAAADAWEQFEATPGPQWVSGRRLTPAERDALTDA